MSDALPKTIYCTVESNSSHVSNKKKLTESRKEHGAETEEEEDDYDQKYLQRKSRSLSFQDKNVSERMERIPALSQSNGDRTEKKEIREQYLAGSETPKQSFVDGSSTSFGDKYAPKRSHGSVVEKMVNKRSNQANNDPSKAKNNDVLGREVQPF